MYPYIYIYTHIHTNSVNGFICGYRHMNSLVLKKLIVFVLSSLFIYNLQIPNVTERSVSSEGPRMLGDAYPSFYSLEASPKPTALPARMDQSPQCTKPTLYRAHLLIHTRNFLTNTSRTTST